MSRPAAVVLTAGLAVAATLGSVAAVTATATGAGSGNEVAPPDSSEPADAGPTAGAPSGHPADQAGADVAVEAEPGNTKFERQLAELAFATFLSTEMAVDSGTYSCTEPAALDRGTAITCFTVINGERLVVAATTVSGGTGVYEFDIVADTELTAPAPTDTGGPDSSAPPVAERPGDPAADAAVLANGEAINASSPAFVAQYLSDPRITAIATYAFDPATSILTLDMTLVPDSAIDLDEMAWANTQAFARYHWTAGQPFRTPGAALRPGFTFIVDGNAFASDYDVMVAVASQTITMDQWLAAVGRG